MAVQADLQNAVAAYLASQVPAGSTLDSVIQTQPAPPAGTSLGTDPRNVFMRGLRANAASATITAGDVQPSPQVVTAADTLLSQVEGYGNAASGSAPMQAFVTLAEPTAANTSGILDQPLARVVQAAADSASWGLGLVQDGADTMFGLAADAIDTASSVLTDSWDIPLVTDIYTWVTNGSALSALDVACLLLAVPVTLTYKALFGETPVPDQVTLDAIMAAYPAPPALGSNPAAVEASAGTDADAAATTWEIVQRLGGIISGTSYIASGFFEAQVDIGLVLWTLPSGGEPEHAQCPAEWRDKWWSGKLSAIWEWAYVITETLAQVSACVLTFAPSGANLDCSTVVGQANWLWVIGNLQWIPDLIAVRFAETVVQALWRNAGPLCLTFFGVVQIVLQIVAWFRLGAKGWAGSAAGLLTSLPNAGKILMSPQAQLFVDDIPIPGMVEAGIDVCANFYGGILYLLNAAITS